MTATGKCGICGEPIWNSAVGFCQRRRRCRSAYSAEYQRQKRARLMAKQAAAAPPAPPVQQTPTPRPARAAAEEIGPGLHTTRKAEVIRPEAVVNGCAVAMRECLLDLKKYADRGLAMLDVMDKRIEESKNAPAQPDGWFPGPQLDALTSGGFSRGGQPQSDGEGSR